MVCVVALATKVLAVVLCVGGTPDHAIQCVQRQALPAVASGLLVRPMGSSVAKQPLQGLTAQPLARLAQRAGADGFIVLPRQCQLQYLGHVHDGAVSKQGHTQYQPKCLLHGQSPLAQCGDPVHLQSLFNPLVGYAALNYAPLLRCRKLVGIAQVLLQQHRPSAGRHGPAQFTWLVLYKQQRPRGAFA